MKEVKEITIDGTVYMLRPKLDIIIEKYATGNYIMVYPGEIYKNMWFRLDIDEASKPFAKLDNIQFIHVKDKSIVDAYMIDNTVEIQVEKMPVDSSSCWEECKDFFETYNKNYRYQLKPKIKYPIFKRDDNDSVHKYTDSTTIYGVLSYHENYFGQDLGTTLDYIGEDLTKFVEIPFDDKRQLYHLQPVWCWNNDESDRTIRCYDANKRMAINSACSSVYNYDNYEAISASQLKVMPFIWYTYKRALKAVKDSEC